MHLPGVILAALAVAAAAVATAAPVQASQVIERNAKEVTLAVDAKGDALIELMGPTSAGSSTYTKKDLLLDGKVIGALPPTPGGHQAHWDNGSIHLNPYDAQGFVKRFKDVCRPYDGPPLAFLVKACKAPDGSYWALQDWQTPLPDLGFTPWRANQSEHWLHASHWKGPLPRLQVWQDWVYDGRYQELFGVYSYNGSPVYGFGTTAVGAPTDPFGRLIYVDTFNSVYGTGWRRENSFVPHNPTGLFCYGFYPFDPTNGGYAAPPGYAGGSRGPGTGTAYRLTSEGPGVTPDVVWQGPGAHPFDKTNAADVQLEARMSAQLASILGPDKICPLGHPLKGVTPAATPPLASIGALPGPGSG